MDKTIRRYTDFREMKDDEYRYWQSRPVHESIAAVAELTQELYAMKGEALDVRGLQRTIVHFERTPGEIPCCGRRLRRRHSREASGN